MIDAARGQRRLHRIQHFGQLQRTLAHQIEEDYTQQAVLGKSNKKIRAQVPVHSSSALPILLFLGAKIVAYTLLGALLGFLGSYLSLSPTTRAILMIAIGVFMNKGILKGIAAYTLWGLFPIYWKMLHQVPALQVIGNRIVWSFLLLAVVVLFTHQWTAFRMAAASPRIIGIYSVAGVLLTINWLVYVWGVNSGFIVETSLGYFINPLVSVLLGVLFVHERLRTTQWIPIGIATIGVAYLTVVYGRLPWPRGC